MITLQNWILINTKVLFISSRFNLTKTKKTKKYCLNKSTNCLTYINYVFLHNLDVT